MKVIKTLLVAFVIILSCSTAYAAGYPMDRETYQQSTNPLDRETYRQSTNPMDRETYRQGPGRYYR